MGISQNVNLSMGTELVFIDLDVQQSGELASIVDRNAEIVLIDAESDPIDQISRSIAKHSSVRTVHLISHGRSGELQLAGQTIDSDRLAKRGQDLNGWRRSLAADADILIYGCDVADGKAGQQLMQTLALLTGADVAGSTDRTGSVDQGGNWTLESATGLIESQLIASSTSLATVSVALPITIRAAGSEGEEQMQLQIDGTTVQTWNNIGGNADARQFQTFTYDGGAGVTADQVRVVFSNDLYQPAEGIDRNLHVDSININGNVFQTEDSSVFSTGTWQDGVITPGFKESETLHTNGYFQFAESSQNNGSEFSIFAAGNENSESMELWIDGNQAATWTNIGGDASSRQFVRYDFTAESTVDINDVQVRFTNDLYINDGEVDRNLRVDRIVLDGVTYQTEAPNVFSTGTWRDGGVTPGFKQDETLHVNGYFQYGDSATSQPGTIALETSNITINEDAGNAEVRVLRSGGSDGTLTVDYATVASSATAGQDYTAQNGTLTFADGVTQQSIVIPILNDSDVESTESFNVTIDNVVGGGTLLVPRTATVTIIDDEIALPQYNNFASTAGLDFNGSARKLGNRLEITPDSTSQAGSVFFESALTLGNDASFQSAFSFEFAGGTGGADGLTFAIQADPDGSSALGSSGGSLGYDGIANSVAIEFDTYRNGGYDPNDNHVSIISGNTSNSLRTVSTDIDLNSGNRLYAWVDYNGVSDSLSVYLSETATKPELALAKTTIDLESVVGPNAYFGFTGGTGGLTNQTLIRQWNMNQQAPPANPPTEIGDTVVAIDVVTGVAQPTAIDWLPDGTMLIAQKSGVVQTATDGQTGNSPFIDISAIVNNTRDRGLLDLAVHPDFENNPYVYLLFTYDPPEVFEQSAGTLAGPDGRGNRAGRLIRVTADANNDFKTAVAGSEVVLLGENSTWDNFNGFANSTFNFDEAPAGENADGTYVQDFIPSDSESHTVGGLAFGIDGELFVSTGDGASYNRVDVRADRVQDIDSLSGKILRIDPITGDGLADNPFYNGNANANRSKVYQSGLRNPFRISVDNSTGQLYVGDVGWSRWEEVNAAGPGANFGWPFYEGRSGELEEQTRYLSTPEGQAWLERNEFITPSIYALSHQSDGINAIVMGDAYRGSAYGSEYQGDVFFNDLGQGIVRHASINPDGSVGDVNVFTTGANVVVAISEGPDGALYYVDLDDSKIGRWELV
ncbi:DUF4347 domain-containing protein [Rubripirellula obstinata]|nr:DUF4347 domain-containing protein [Rubripirellula obstinata]